MEREKRIIVDKKILNTLSVQNPLAESECLIPIKHFTKEYQKKLLEYNYGTKES